MKDRNVKKKNLEQKIRYKMEDVWVFMLNIRTVEPGRFERT